MVEELPPEIEIGTIKLEPDLPYSYSAWGIRYRYKGGSWHLLKDMAFRKKSDAEEWMKEKVLYVDGMEAEVVPVKRTLLLKENGIIEYTMEELS